MKQLVSLKKLIEEMQLPFAMFIDQSETAERLTPNTIKAPIGWL
jgi:hypothetical protein